MRHRVFFGMLFVSTFLAAAPVHARATADSKDGKTESPMIRNGVVGAQLREGGALLMEDVKGDVFLADETATDRLGNQGDQDMNEPRKTKEEKNVPEPKFTVLCDGEPTDEAISALARLLLAMVDEEPKKERQVTSTADQGKDGER